MNKSRLRIIVGHGHSSIEVFHSLIPIILLAIEKKDIFDIRFIDYRFFSLNKFDGDLLIIVRKFKDNGFGDICPAKIIEEIESYRNRFSKIIYFEDSATLSSILFFLIPHVDSYWVRGILLDKSNYEKCFYGGRIFSEYYHDKYNIIDKKISKSTFSVDPFSNKIKIAWNIGIGCLPTNKYNFFNRNYRLIKRSSCILSSLELIYPLRLIIKKYQKLMLEELSTPIDEVNTIKKIGARFPFSHLSNSVGFQRKFILDKISNNKLFVTGQLSNWEYIKESSSFRGMLSPFGWGEICYRDFESALYRNVLIKPSMEHLLTWPNIYQPFTYFKLDWDFNNLDDLDEFISSNNQIIYYINNARKIYLDGLNQCTSRAYRMILDVIK